MRVHMKILENTISESRVEQVAGEQELNNLRVECRIYKNEIAESKALLTVDEAANHEMKYQLATLQERGSKAFEEANRRHTDALVAANDRIEQLCNKNAEFLVEENTRHSANLTDNTSRFTKALTLANNRVDELTKDLRESKKRESDLLEKFDELGGDEYDANNTNAGDSSDSDSDNDESESEDGVDSDPPKNKNKNGNVNVNENDSDNGNTRRATRSRSRSPLTPVGPTGTGTTTGTGTNTEKSKGKSSHTGGRGRGQGQGQGPKYGQGRGQGQGQDDQMTEKLSSIVFGLEEKLNQMNESMQNGSFQNSNNNNFGTNLTAGTYILLSLC